MEQDYIRNIQVLGWFGRDLDGNYSEEKLQYLSLPEGFSYDKKSIKVDWNLHFDLPDDETRWNGTTFEHIPEWIMRHCKTKEHEPCMPEADFVCKRKDLQYLMLNSKYNNFSNLIAVRLNGVIHFKMFCDDELEWRERCNRTKTVPTYQKYGARFENFLLTDVVGGHADPKRPTRRYDDMALVFKANIGHHTVMYAGEVDGLPSNANLNNLDAARLVELKTSMKVEKRFLPDWWVQCSLSKCDAVLLGKRNDCGYVHELEWLSVDEIENMMRSAPRHTPNVNPHRTQSRKQNDNIYTTPNRRRLMEKKDLTPGPRDLVGNVRNVLDMLASTLHKDDGKICLFKKKSNEWQLVEEQPPKHVLDQLLPESYKEWAKQALPYVHF